MAGCETKNNNNDLMLIDYNDLVKQSPYHPSNEVHWSFPVLAWWESSLNWIAYSFKKQNNNKPSLRNYPRPDQDTTDL